MTGKSSSLTGAGGAVAGAGAGAGEGTGVGEETGDGDCSAGCVSSPEETEGVLGAGLLLGAFLATFLGAISSQK